MEGIIKASVSTENENLYDMSEEDVLRQLKDVTTQLKRIYQHYNLLTDEDLIESCIYEMQAINARYSHLIKIAKQRNLTSETKNNRESNILEGVFRKLG